MAKLQQHSFYCINCGKKAYELMRKTGHQYPRFHRKKMYCPYCKQEINMVECKNEADIFEFRNDFINGVYKDEAEDSISFIRTTR